MMLRLAQGVRDTTKTCKLAQSATKVHIRFPKTYGVVL